MTPPTLRPARRRVRRIVATLLALAVVVATYVFALPQFANYTAVWHAVQGMSWLWVGVLAGTVLLNILTFPPPWMVVLPGLRFLDALRMTQASTAFSLVVPGGAPMGMAASFAMLRAWSFRSADVGLAVALTGIWNQVSVFLFPVAAVALLAVEGVGSAPLALVTVLGVALTLAIAALFAAVLWSPSVAFAVGNRAARVVSRLARLLRREAVAWDGGMFVRHRATTLQVLRRRWHSLTVATLANQLTGYALLDLSLRAVGIGRGDISIAESFAAWSVGRLLISLPITPGGAGVVEVGLVGTLVGFGGRHAPVVAGVLIYRFLSVVPTLVLGAVSALSWRLGQPQRGATPSP